MRPFGLVLCLLAALRAAEPIKLENLLTVLQRKNVPVARLLALVEESGIDFKATDDELAKLRQAGASAPLIDLVRKKAAEREPHVVIEAPKPKMAGPFSFTCLPGECDVAVNGKPFGKTAGGKILIPEMNPGTYAIDFTREGYMGEQVMLQAVLDQPVTQKVRLKPSPDTLRAEGPKLFAKVVERYGGEKALQDGAAIESAGELTLVGQGGKRSVFELDVLQKVPSLIRMRIESAKLDWTTAFKGRETIKTGGKLKDTAVVMEFEKFVREYRDFEPAGLLAGIVSDQPRLEADPEPLEDKSRVLRCVSATEVLQLTIGEDGLIAKVSVESKAGLATGVEAVYAAYQDVGAVPHPKSVIIRHAASEGAEFKFGEFKAAPKATERDFRK